MSVVSGAGGGKGVSKRVGKYDMGRTLGQGTFGKVKYAIDTTTGTPVAIKVMLKQKIREAHMGAQIKKEVRLSLMLQACCSPLRTSATE